MTEETIKKYKEMFNSALLNEDKSIKWNPIENSTRSFIEFKDYSDTDVYLEKDGIMNVVIENAHIPDVIKKYGSDHWYYEMLSKNMLYKADSQKNIDNHIYFHYHMKTESEVLEMLNIPLESFKDNFEYNMRSQIDILKVFRKLNMHVLGDLLEKEPEDLVNEAGISPIDIIDIQDAVYDVYKDYGKKYIAAYYKEAKKKYLVPFSQFTADGVLDPLEREQLEEVRYKLGLPSWEAEDDYIKENFSDEHRLIQYESVDFKKMFEDENIWFNISQDASKSNEGLLPYINCTDKKLYKEYVMEYIFRPKASFATMDALSEVFYSEKCSVYVEMKKKDTYYEFGRKYIFVDFKKKTIEDISYEEVIRKALEIIGQWDKDTLPKEKAEQCRLIESIISKDEILIPIDADIHYKISGRYVRKEESAWEGIEDIIPELKPSDMYVEPKEAVNMSIRDYFIHSAEEIRNISKRYDNNDIEVWLKQRGYVAGKKGDYYGNFDFKACTDALKSKLTTELTTKRSMMADDLEFYEVEVSRPVEFLTKAGHKVSVDEENIRKFSMTEEEYAKSLDAEELKKQGKSFKEEIKNFVEEKKDFMEVLEAEPLTKRFVNETIENLKKS